MLCESERRKHHESLDMEKVLDSTEFWKTMKPFLSDKSTIFSQSSIENNNKITS